MTLRRIILTLITIVPTSHNGAGRRSRKARRQRLTVSRGRSLHCAVIVARPKHLVTGLNIAFQNKTLLDAVMQVSGKLRARLHSKERCDGSSALVNEQVFEIDTLKRLLPLAFACANRQRLRRSI